jgi:hypothetical protein
LNRTGGIVLALLLVAGCGGRPLPVSYAPSRAPLGVVEQRCDTLAWWGHATAITLTSDPEANAWWFKVRFDRPLAWVGGGGSTARVIASEGTALDYFEWSAERYDSGPPDRWRVGRFVGNTGTWEVPEPPPVWVPVTPYCDSLCVKIPLAQIDFVPTRLALLLEHRRDTLTYVGQWYTEVVVP